MNNADWLPTAEEEQGLILGWPQSIPREYVYKNLSKGQQNPLVAQIQQELDCVLEFDWKRFAILLGMHPSLVNKIEACNLNRHEFGCLILQECLRTGKCRSWNDVVLALAELGNIQRASEIRRRYSGHLFSKRIGNTGQGTYSVVRVIYW